MKTIRFNTFETNSSSTHSLLILTDEENSKLNTGELYLVNKYDDTIITKEERDKILLKAIEEYNSQNPDDKVESIEDYMETDDYLDNQSEFPCDLDTWVDSDYLSYDYYNYTSPSGDKLIIHALYGYNG